jgi:hypothetical protein
VPSTEAPRNRTNLFSPPSRRICPWIHRPRCLSRRKAHGEGLDHPQKLRPSPMTRHLCGQTINSWHIELRRPLMSDEDA